MPYEFYMGKLLLPVTPSKLQMKVGNQNHTLTLIDEGEINILKKSKLMDIEFDVLIPQTQYPFAVYKDGFQGAKYYLEAIDQMKLSQEPFQFIVSRTMPNGRLLFYTNNKVSLEDYKITEDSKDGFDIQVSISLKQYRDYGLKECKISLVNENPKGEIQANRASPKSTAKTYTVIKGDCLWNIAKRFYGNGSKYPVIANANKDKIKSPNLIHPGMVLTIPAI